MDVELIHPDNRVLARGSRGGGGTAGAAACGGGKAAGDRRGPPRGSAGGELQRVRGALVAVAVIALLITGPCYHCFCRRDQRES